MGCPADGDDHPVHGELPNANYQYLVGIGSQPYLSPRSWSVRAEHDPILRSHPHPITSLCQCAITPKRHTIPQMNHSDLTLPSVSFFVVLGVRSLHRHAYISSGSDERGEYLEIGGTYDHIVAFTANYRAEPTLRVRPGSGVVEISIALTNRFHKPMELMYMAHTNFIPTEGARLVCTHPDSELAVSGSVNGLVLPSPEHLAFLDELRAKPAKHAVLDRRTIGLLNPEVLVYLRKFKAGEDGCAHSVQLLPSGAADYVGHRPAQLPLATRWMVSDGSQAALGLTLPATAEPAGKTAERAKGNLQTLPAGSMVRYEVEVGALEPAEAAAMVARIGAIMA